ncbi:MAG: hypothetical protein RLZZ502_1792 [Pseudomonadota bacterium]
MQRVAEYIVSAGGKRLRPALVYLCVQLVEGQISAKEHEAAAVIELIHTATLLHDDVVDDSKLRRGRHTANAAFGNAASVLVGDFLYSRAFQMMNRLGHLRIFDLLANATNVIAQGEVQQLMNVGNIATTEADYQRVIEAKTATLFSAACEMAMVLQQQSDERCRAAYAFGHHLGVAFQIADDVLDLTGKAEEMGKNLGDDLAEGKLTLPMIYALQHATTAEQLILHQAVQQPEHSDMVKVLDIFKRTGSLEYALRQAQQANVQAKTCLRAFSPNAAHDLLMLLCDYAIARKS